MITYSQEDIVKALKVLKTTCLEYDCKHCPFFGSREEECILLHFVPADYCINEEAPVWRALQ